MTALELDKAAKEEDGVGEAPETRAKSSKAGKDFLAAAVPRCTRGFDVGRRRGDDNCGQPYFPGHVLHTPQTVIIP